MPTQTLDELRAAFDESVSQAEEFANQHAGQAITGEDVETMNRIDAAMTEAETRLREAEQAGGTLDRMRERIAEAGASRGAGRRLYQGDGTPAAGGHAEDPVTPGEIFTASDVYREWMQRFPSGGPAKGAYQADPVQMGVYRQILGLRTPTERFRGGLMTPDRFRTLITAADASAGTLVRPDFRGLLEPGLVRPLTVRQLVTTIPTSSDAIEYVREVSRVSGAAPVAEATALTGSSGLKPEGGLVFEVVTDTVKTIAEWVAATRRIIADAPQLRGYIDQYLTDDLGLEVEDQMVSGSGTGQDFLGILNTPNVQTAGPPSGSQNMLDVIRTAKRLIRVNARTNATAVLFNPENAEQVDTIKASTAGTYFGPGPFAPGANSTLWGLPIVECEAIPTGFALVGDFRRAVFYDREDVTISVGTANDDFLRNLVRVLAELRAGFGVLRPKAFVIVDLVA